MSSRIGAVLLVLLTLVAYGPIRHAGFIWDDDDYVTENGTLRSAAGLGQMWLEPKSIPQYYPLVHSTFWVEYQLWRLNPLGYHVVNVLLHAVSAILLWRLLLRLDVPGAWLAAAIFAVHPVMVESVAWITERKNVLSLPLALGSILCYLRFAPAEAADVRRKADPYGQRYYWLALALFAGALLSKSVVCSVPAVLLVIYWWKRGSLGWPDVRPLLPMFGMGLVAATATAWLEKHHVGATGAEWDLSLVERILLAGRVIWFYAAKLAWPWPVMFFYPRWEIDSRVPWQFLFPLGVLAVVAVLWMLRERIGRGPLAAVLIFAGVLTPALGFIDVYPFRYSFVADHFQYHASLALIALAAAAATLVAARLPRLTSGWIAGGAGAAVLAILVALTWQQVHVYENVETLYGDVLRKNPTAWIAYVNLSNHYAGVERPDRALEVITQGLAARPDIAEIQAHYGAHLLRSTPSAEHTPEQLAEVERHLREAQKLQPLLPDVDFNLAMVLLKQGRQQEAIERFERALSLDPNDQSAALQLGLAHFDLGGQAMKNKQFEKAARHYRAAAAARPDSAQAFNNLGIALMNLQRPGEAILAFQRAVAVDPKDPQFRGNLQRARESIERPAVKGS